MAWWTSDELRKIGGSGRSGDCHCPERCDAAAAGDDLYVRSVNGRSATWFRGAQTDAELDVYAVQHLRCL